MSIDTAEKRFSMMGLGNPVLKLVVPSGSVDASERATFLDLYAGIALSSVTGWVGKFIGVDASASNTIVGGSLRSAISKIIGTS